MKVHLFDMLVHTIDVNLNACDMLVNEEDVDLTFVDMKVDEKNVLFNDDVVDLTPVDVKRTGEVVKLHIVVVKLHIVVVKHAFPGWTKRLTTRVPGSSWPITRLALLGCSPPRS